MDLEAAAAAAGEPCAPAFGAQERIDYAGLPKVSRYLILQWAVVCNWSKSLINERLLY